LPTSTDKQDVNNQLRHFATSARAIIEHDGGCPELWPPPSSCIELNSRQRITVPADARLIISTSGFSTANTDLRYRWFDGENDGCSRATTFVFTWVPGTSTSKATGPRLLESTAPQFDAPAHGFRVA